MKTAKMFGLVAVLVALFAFALPAAAQDTPAASPSTITVYGSATAEGAPDEATLELGVDVFTQNVSESFAASNVTIRAIYDAIIALGVAILTETWPPRERGKVIGFSAGFISLGIVFGPAIGGVVTPTARR